MIIRYNALMFLSDFLSILSNARGELVNSLPESEFPGFFDWYVRRNTNSDNRYRELADKLGISDIVVSAVAQGRMTPPHKILAAVRARAITINCSLNDPQCVHEYSADHTGGPVYIIHYKPKTETQTHYVPQK